MMDSIPSPGETADRYALDDDVVSEILLRLPSASVLRCRAVCKAWRRITTDHSFLKAWRRITTDHSFLAAHAERQPAELLVVSGGRPHHQLALETIPLSLQVDDDHGLTRRELKHPDEHCHADRLVFSCDGLLLFENLRVRKCPSNLFMACNPVTRQWTWLDVTPPACCGKLVLLCGFYLHGPSGEHRLLVLANERQRLTCFHQPYIGHLIDEGSAAHYVFSAVSSGAPRRLGPVAGNIVVQPYSQVPKHCVSYRGKLHWTEHPVATTAGKILAFHTVSESLRLILRPPQYYHYADDLCLLELDGRLAATVAAEKRPDSMELWVLDNYDDDRSWSHRLRIDLPPLFDARWATGTGFPDVILVAAAPDVIVAGSHASSSAVLYHLTEKRIVKRMEFVSGKPGGHFVFKDSLVSHDFFHPY